jgi:hypothetical protein
MTKNDNCNGGVPQEPTLSEILASLEDQQAALMTAITEIGLKLFSIDSPKMSAPDGSVSQRLGRLLQENIGLLELSKEILRKL